MANIQLTASGYHTIGNYSADDFDIISGTGNNIREVKTLIDGKWVSWHRSAPSAFNGFNKMKSGQGYIVYTVAPDIVAVPNTELNIINTPIVLGDNMLAFPDNRVVPADGKTLKYEFNELKTILGGVWVSWSLGAPENLQGFSTLNKDRGYYAYIVSGEGIGYDEFTGSEGPLIYALALGITAEFIDLPDNLDINDLGIGFRYALYSRKNSI